MPPRNESTPFALSAPLNVNRATINGVFSRNMVACHRLTRNNKRKDRKAAPVRGEGVDWARFSHVGALIISCSWVKAVAGSVQIDKLLHTIIQVKAGDLFITVGSKPALKKGGHLRSWTPRCWTTTIPPA